MPHNRVIIEGQLGGTEERWSTSCAFQGSLGDAVVDPDLLSNWCNAIMANLDINPGFSGGLKNMIGSSSTFDKVSAYFYPSVAGNATAAGESTVAAVAGSGGVILPYQSSLVFTLQTGQPGRSYRGRMYLPFVTAAMVNGRISTSSTTLAARALQVSTLLATIADEMPSIAGGRPVIVSKAQNAITPVISVRVGNVMDTQRRRRDALAESFGTAPV